MAAWMALARHVGTASLAGIITGVVVGGLLGRVVMRVSGFIAGPAMVGVRTSNGNRVGDVTLEGTLALVLFTGLASGLFGGIVYAVVEPWLRRARPWHGLAFGVGLFLASGFLVLDPFNFDFRRFGVAVLNVAMFAALFVVFGVVTAWLFDTVKTLRTGTSLTAQVTDAAAWFAIVPVVLAAVLIVFSVEAWFAVVGTMSIIGPLLIAAFVRWRALPEMLGYASLAVGVLLGAARTLSGLPQLIGGL